MPRYNTNYRNARTRRGRRSYGHKTPQQVAAEKHIEEYNEFKEEIGGSVDDVKKYFFTLSDDRLPSVLEEYRKKYGESAYNYALQAIPKWRTGRTKMSGQTAKRLFDLLPKHMTPKEKYSLAESVWRHFGPQSHRSFTVGCDANVSDIESVISEKLYDDVSLYEIPENVKRRFNWLSGNDVKAKEQLLNFFRQNEKELGIQKIREFVPILQKQVRDNKEKTGLSKTTLEIHRHRFDVFVTSAEPEVIREGAPKQGRAASSESGWVWLVIGAIIIAIIAFS